MISTEYVILEPDNLLIQESNSSGEIITSDNLLIPESNSLDAIFGIDDFLIQETDSSKAIIAVDEGLILESDSLEVVMVADDLLIPETNSLEVVMVADDVLTLESNSVNAIDNPIIPVNNLATEESNVLATTNEVIFVRDIVGSDAIDIIVGTEQNERIFGLGGDDFIQGGGGSNFIDGGDGNDIIFGGLISGLAGKENLNDTIYGGNGDDVLFGNDGDDYLNGGDGDDFLCGGAGDDILTGGAGKNTFYFHAPLVSNTKQGEADSISSFTVSLGVDTITDFTPGEDTILLSKQLFSNLSKVVNFGTVFTTVDNDLAVETSNALIVYNSVNGNLFYNENGSESGFGNGGLFAVLTGAPAITASDFSVPKMTS
jgi:Ca2+-binding RTX toxin-like protein